MVKQKILLTGGAGFIGSNIAEKLVSNPQVDKLIVLDNLSTGFEDNISALFSHPKFTFIKGDIRDYKTCLEASKGVNIVCHQAALGSVPRSISDPLQTNEVNISGTLNVFTAAKEAGIKKIVYAASSSTYGDSKSLPKVEDVIGNPMSPYAITKYVNELYANIYSKVYGVQFIGLRYFNVFGPKQNPDGAYAAVVPLFINALMENKTPVINGDGLQSRDFTYVDNAVEANVKALFSENPAAWNNVYNIAVGEQTTIREMFNILCAIEGITMKVQFGPDRIGDVKHSLADISKAKALLKYIPTVNIREGLSLTYAWHKHRKAIVS
jgi:UDP-N-acetylglucosamine 4-epimerase